jgi:propionyl-CoA synthetase
MFTAPTALRAIRKDDPDNAHFTRIGERGGLRSLNALFLAGERSEPAIITMYQDLLQKYAAENALVIDNWWSSESGSPISGVALVPHAGKNRATGMKEEQAPLGIKPGSAGKAMPGFDVRYVLLCIPSSVSVNADPIRVVDDEGSELPRGKMGNIVLGLPLAPTAFRTLWQDGERFYKGYLKRFSGKWLDTGDAGWIDDNGYISIMARTGKPPTSPTFLQQSHYLSIPILS